MTILDRLDSNWSREEREKVNDNWTIIESYLSNLQGQINFLTGNVNVQGLIDQLKSLLSQGTIILDELKSALINVEEIIVDAQNATNDANDAAQKALNAVDEIQSMLDNFQVRGTYDNDTVYSKNNSIFYEGSSYIYKNNTPSKGNPPPNYPTVANDHWQMTAAKGASGDGAVSKVNGKEPDGTGEVILTASDVGAASAEQLDQIEQTVDTHSNNQQIHVTQAKQNNWNVASTNATNLINRFPETCAIVTDWNNVVKNGFYMGSNVANAPDNAWWMGTVIVHDANYVRQKVMEVTGDREFERVRHNGTWYAWHETSPLKLFQSVSNGKAAVNQAVTDKGVYTAPDAPFATTAANIRAIQTQISVKGEIPLSPIPSNGLLEVYTPWFDFQPMYFSSTLPGASLCNGFATPQISTATNAFYILSLDTYNQVVNGVLQYRLKLLIKNAYSFTSTQNKIDYFISK